MMPRHRHQSDASWSAFARQTFGQGLWLVRFASMLVPACQRDEWMAEWAAELFHRIDALDVAGLLDWPARWNVFVRCAGALAHALSVRFADSRQNMLIQDIQYAVRTNLRRPAFSLVVIATLALGIGATSAMFSIVDAILIRPLPYERSSELVSVYGAIATAGAATDRTYISPPDYLDYREQSSAFAAFAARTAFGTAVLAGQHGDAPERVSIPFVSANFFSTLGVKPIIGRGFLPSEEDGNGHDVVVLSHGLWQRRFNGDRGVVGATVLLDGERRTVIGVMSPTIERTFPDQMWRPFIFHIEESSHRRAHMLRGIARLKPGVSIEQARANVDGIAHRLAAIYPEDASWHLALVPYRDIVVGNVGPALLLLLGAVALVLLIACGNVASLMLARATTRESELAVRVALGASRTQIVWQLLTETLLLGVAAGAVGLAIAALFVRVVHAVAGGILPRLSEVGINANAVFFTFALSLVTGLVFGIAPAVLASRQSLAGAMRSLGRTSAGGRHLRVRDVLVVAQVALSLVLLLGAGLMLRSLWMVEHVELGFEPRHVMTGQVTLPRTYQTRVDVERFWDTFLARVRARPGVQLAAGATALPLRGGSDTRYHLDGHASDADADGLLAQIDIVTDDYFSALRIPLVAGRVLGPVDRAGGSEEAGHGSIAINRSMAARLFPNGNAVGKRIVLDFGQPFSGEIVGVVADVHTFGQDVGAPDIVYVSSHQVAGNFDGRIMNLVVRTKGDAAVLAAPIRAALTELERTVPFSDVATMERLLGDSTAGTWFRARLLAGFALVALILAAIGLYGVLAYAVTQRTREIGVRIALGARRGAVMQLILVRGLTLVGAGLVLGVGAGLLTTRLLDRMLFGVSTTDPAVFAAVIGVLALTALAACLLPAWRATRVDPITALRAE
ncbi:MAG: ABC transporter permease [bacterium]